LNPRNARPDAGQRLSGADISQEKVIARSFNDICVMAAVVNSLTPLSALALGKRKDISMKRSFVCSAVAIRKDEPRLI